MLYCYEHRVASEVSCWTCVWCLNHWTPTRSMILIYTFRSLPTKVFFWFHCILQPNRPTGHCQRFWTGGPLLWVTLCLKIRAFATWKMVDMEREIFQDSNFQDGAESSRNRWVGTQHERTYDGHRIYDEMWCRHHWPQKIWLPPRGPNFGPKFSAWDQNLPLFCFVTSSGLSRLGHEAEGAFGVSRDHGAMDFFGANDLTILDPSRSWRYWRYWSACCADWNVMKCCCHHNIIELTECASFPIYILPHTVWMDLHMCVCAIHISYMYIYNYIYYIYISYIKLVSYAGESQRETVQKSGFFFSVGQIHISFLSSGLRQDGWEPFAWLHSNSDAALRVGCCMEQHGKGHEIPTTKRGLREVDTSLKNDLGSIRKKFDTGTLQFEDFKGVRIHHDLNIIKSF